MVRAIAEGISAVGGDRYEARESAYSEGLGLVVALPPKQ